MTNDKSLESSCAVLLESANEFANLKKIVIFFKIQLYSKKVLQNNKCPKNNKIYIFEKLLTMPFQICKTFCKILNNLIGHLGFPIS